MRARRYACSPLMEPIILSPDGWSDSYRPDYPLQVCRRAHSEEPPVYQFPSSSLGFGAADAKLLFLAQFIENPAQHRQIVGTQHIKRRENHIFCPSLTHLYRSGRECIDAKSSNRRLYPPTCSIPGVLRHHRWRHGRLATLVGSMNGV